MSCCCPHAQSAGRFFSFFARRYRKRFQRKGFEPSQKQLMVGLNESGYQDATLLEIGCGVGHLHQTLLERGAKSAVGIDLAPKMLTEARSWAAERGVLDRVRYIENDFMTMKGDLDQAEVTVLDKVVCCYPDAKGLVHKSLAKTKRVYALTYPRDRWFTRLGTALVSAMLWAIRSDFRSYVHSPVQIETWINAEGFRKHFEDQTVAWLTQIYLRR